MSIDMPLNSFLVVKRVPLDFDWPLNETWKGHKNPFTIKVTKCLTCNGAGTTTAYARLLDLVALLLISSEEAKSGEVHPFVKKSVLSRSQGLVCGLDMVELTDALIGRMTSENSRHDVLDASRVIKKVIECAGLPDTWGKCPTCGDEGQLWESPEAEREFLDWRPEDPPVGPGFQLWTSLGSGQPVTKVYEDPEAMANAMAAEGRLCKYGSGYHSWMMFICTSITF